MKKQIKLTSAVNQLRLDLAARRHEWAKIAKHAKCSYSWIAKFENGTIDNPTVKSLERVQQALDNI